VTTGIPGIDKLRIAADEARDWTDAAIRLGGMMEGPDDPALAYLVALEYIISIDEDSESVRVWGPFAPMMVFHDAVRPVPLREAATDLLDRWSVAVDALDDPLLTSRLHDLLWVRRHGRQPDIHCRSAIRAYRALGTERWLSEYAGQVALGRALQLSRQIGDKAEIDGTIDDLITYLRQAAQESPPGRAVMVAEILADVAGVQRPTAALTAVLESLVTRNDCDVDMKSGAYGLLARLAPDAGSATEWRRRQVITWIAEADRTSGLVRAHHLDRALALAGNFGLRDLADQARMAVQSMTDEELDLKTVSAQVDVPAADVEVDFATFRAA
jgi:hypothetical protein